MKRALFFSALLFAATVARAQSGMAFNAVTAPTVSSGDVSAVGNCTSGACFQSVAANQFLASPSAGGAGPAEARIISNFDLPSILDFKLASSYSGVGACAAGSYVATLNDNGAPTCVALPVATRSVRVDADATANGTTVFNTLSAAITYVTAQTRSGEARWQIVLVGGSSYTEAATIAVPSFTELVGGWGGGIYAGGDATTIRSSVTAGAVLTLDNTSGLRNLVLSVEDVPTAARVAVDCIAPPSSKCSLDHVGIVVHNSNSFADTAYQSCATGVVGSNLYYVVITMGFTSTLSTAIKNCNTNQVILDNFWLTDGNSSQGKGIHNTGAGYVVAKNGLVGAGYTDSGWATDLAADAGTIHVQDVGYLTSSGTIASRDRVAPPLAAAPQVACSADTEGFTYTDTSHALCWCNGTAYQVVSGAGACS